MALNEAETDRSYLFGRVLAYAEELERCALREAGENRETNAQRLRFQYVQHPAKTLDILYGRLETSQKYLDFFNPQKKTPT